MGQGLHLRSHSLHPLVPDIGKRLSVHVEQLFIVVHNVSLRNVHVEMVVYDQFLSDNNLFLFFFYCILLLLPHINIRLFLAYDLLLTRRLQVVIALIMLSHRFAAASSRPHLSLFDSISRGSHAAGEGTAFAFVCARGG